MHKTSADDFKENSAVEADAANRRLRSEESKSPDGKAGDAQNHDAHNTQVSVARLAMTENDEEFPNAAWSFSTWSWGDPDMPQQDGHAGSVKATKRDASGDSTTLHPETRSSILGDLAWMVIEPMVGAASPTSSTESADNRNDGLPTRRRSLEAPTRPPPGCGQALLHYGRAELQEGYLGWWRPCRLELWPGRIRAVALPSSESPPPIPPLPPADNVAKAQQTLAKNVTDDNSESECLWQMHIDPSSFEQVCLVPDTPTFEVGGEQAKVTFRCASYPDAVEWVEHISLIANWVKEQCVSRKWAFVYLNVYDLAGDWRVGVFNRMSLDMLQIGGMFHAGVEVYGREYMFGGGGEPAVDEDFYSLTSPEETGVTSCTPRECDRHSFRQTECLGLTILADSEVHELLCVMARDWPAWCYKTLERNCVHFCRDFSERLGVMPVPQWVNYLAGAAAERHVIKPAITQEVSEMDMPALSSEAPEVAYCWAQHSCVLQAQNWMAGFIELIICEACLRELSRGESFWHCSLCDFDMCVACAEEDVRRRLERREREMPVCDEHEDTDSGAADFMRRAAEQEFEKRAVSHS